MIIGQDFVQFESYIYFKITKFANVNSYFFLVISSLLVVRSNVEPKLSRQYHWASQTLLNNYN
jgi:hypothetical protein